MTAIVKSFGHEILQEASAQAHKKTRHQETPEQENLNWGFSECFSYLQSNRLFEMRSLEEIQSVSVNSDPFEDTNDKQSLRKQTYRQPVVVLKSTFQPNELSTDAGQPNEKLYEYSLVRASQLETDASLQNRNLVGDHVYNVRGDKAQTNETLATPSLVPGHQEMIKLTIPASVHFSLTKNVIDPEPAINQGDHLLALQEQQNQQQERQPDRKLLSGLSEEVPFALLGSSEQGQRSTQILGQANPLHSAYHEQLKNEELHDVNGDTEKENGPAVAKLSFTKEDPLPSQNQINNKSDVGANTLLGNLQKQPQDSSQVPQPIPFTLAADMEKQNENKIVDIKNLTSKHEPEFVTGHGDITSRTLLSERLASIQKPVSLGENDKQTALKNLIQELSDAIRNKSNHMRIQLTPYEKELGSIDIRLKLSDSGHAIAHFEASKEEAYHLLRSATNTIEDILKNFGFETTPNSLSFSLNQDGQQNGQQNHFAQQTQKNVQNISKIGDSVVRETPAVRKREAVLNPNVIIDIHA